MLKLRTKQQQQKNKNKMKINRPSLYSVQQEGYISLVMHLLHVDQAAASYTRAHSPFYNNTCQHFLTSGKPHHNRSGIKWGKNIKATTQIATLFSQHNYTKMQCNGLRSVVSQFSPPTNSLLESTVELRR